jgi:hypothetical protein
MKRRNTEKQRGKEAEKQKNKESKKQRSKETEKQEIRKRKNHLRRVTLCQGPCCTASSSATGRAVNQKT